MIPESHPIFDTKTNSSGKSRRFVFNIGIASKYGVLQGNTLRWCSAGGHEYQYLEFEPRIDYTSVVINESGSLLCLYNSKQVQILAVSWDESKSDTILISPPAGIKQALWHPRGRLGSCLAVLTTQDEICLYELLTEDYTEPTTILNTCTKELGMGSVVKDITSMSFSSDGLTLYLLSTSEGADIYSIYPCLPSEMEISGALLKSVFNKALLQYQDLNDNDSPDLRRKVTKQLQFVSKLQKKNDYKDTESHVVTISKAHRSPRAQGPFTINPFPDNLYLATGRQVEVIKLQGCAAELLLISFDDGTILECFPDREPVMSWEDEGFCENNSLIVLGSVNIGGEIALVNGYTFVVLSSAKVTFVSLRKLAQVIESSLNDCDISYFDEADLSEEVVEKNGRFCSAIICASSEKSCVALLSETTTSHIDIPFSLDAPKMRTALGTAKTDVEQYRPYGQPLNEVLALNEKVQALLKKPLQTGVSPSLRQAKLNNESNEDQLSLLTSISKEVMTRIASAQTLALSLYLRLSCQQGELTQHLETVSKVEELQSKVLRRLKDQSSRWEAAQAKNKSISSRLEQISSKLKQVSSSGKFQSQPISNHELEWFKEIRDQVIRFNRLVHEQQSLGNTLSNLKCELEYVHVESKEGKSGSSSADNKDEVPWDELRALLAKDLRIIGECQDSLQGVAKQLDS